METLAAAARQPVSSGVFIAGVGWGGVECQPGAGTTGLALAPASLLKPGVWAAQSHCDRLL